MCQVKAEGADTRHDVSRIFSFFMFPRHNHRIDFDLTRMTFWHYPENVFKVRHPYKKELRGNVAQDNELFVNGPSTTQPTRVRLHAREFYFEGRQSREIRIFLMPWESSLSKAPVGSIYCGIPCGILALDRKEIYRSES